jgi:alginate O-acetyltransferase complex protein AlgI
MLFNSTLFIFIFFPVTFVVFYALGSLGLRGLAAGWLLVASLFFYGYDDPWHLVPLIVCSITFNYIVGRAIATKQTRAILIAGVVANLALLGYFKYANFLLENLPFFDVAAAPHIALPIGISFFTFTQIAYLVDTHQGKAKEYNPLHYGLFVSFFPHLIAGPILHHNEMMPQFARRETYIFNATAGITGLCWFAAGLFKKVIFADSVEPYASAIFKAADLGQSVDFGQGWLGALAYSLQLYFDFSGYSDMAIGLALMLGIVFPINFNSPYKAVSLIDFWRRWHITLSRFLRDYLYIPLGGNRLGERRRYLNLFVTMLLGGLWHGAAWTFIVWGAIHGLGLLVNHAWRTVGIRLPSFIGRALTLIFVVIAWVPFRASTMVSAMSLWRGMFDPGSGVIFTQAAGWAWVIFLGFVALTLPNTIEIFTRGETIIPPARFVWKPSMRWAVFGGLTFGASLATILGGQPSTFLYFRF